MQEILSQKAPSKNYMIYLRHLKITVIPFRKVPPELIKKVFAIYCDIIDEAGGIATIATILASNNISIKNIGIIHNRELKELLRIEFYDESSSHKAHELLQKYRYIVYER